MRIAIFPDIHGNSLALDAVLQDIQARVGALCVFNPGSVSNPQPPDLRAKYILPDADAQGHRIERHFVEYDRAAVIAILEQLKHPNARFIARRIRGGRRPSWHSAR